MTSSYAAGRPSGTINSGKSATRSPFVDWSTDVASWMDEGACVGSVHPDDFYCDDDGRTSARAIEAAKTVCHSCPVEALCLERALKLEEDSTPWGVWGGKSADERRKIRQERRKSKPTIVVAVAPPKPPEIPKPPKRQGKPGGPKCGTEYGGDVHKRQGETACHLCADARKQARRRRDERRTA